MIDTPSILAAWRTVGGKGKPTLKALRALSDYNNDERGQCRHCGRDNVGHETEMCSDDCPQYDLALTRSVQP